MRRVIALLLVLLLAGCDGIGGMTDVEYVAKAQDYLDKGELRAASIELKNALSTNPENAQARWLLGKLYLDIGNYPAAEKELRRAAELGVSRGSVHPLLAEALYWWKKPEAVLEIQVESGFPPKAKARLLALQGLAELEMKRLERARTLVSDALKLSPNSPDALFAKAALEIRSGNLDQGREILLGIVETNPAYAKAWSVLGDIARSRGELEQAEKYYTNAIESRYVNTADRLKRALVRIGQERYDAAQADLDVLNKVAPKHPGVSYAQGLLLFFKKEYAAAQEAFQTTLSEQEEHGPATYFLGMTHYLQGEYEQAATLFGRILATAPGSVPVRKMLASVRLKQKRYADAEQLLRPMVRKEEKDATLLNLLASSLMAQGKTEEAIGLLKKVVELQPDSPKARIRLGVGLLLEGKGQAGVDVLESAVELDPDNRQADRVLVLHYLDKGDNDKAIEAARSLVGRDANDPVAHHLLGMALLQAGHEAEAVAAFTKALELAPGDPAASHQLALLAIRKGDLEQAEQLYRGVLRRHQDHLATMLRLVGVNARLGNAERMGEILEQAVAEHPDAIPPRVLLGNYYLSRGDQDKARELLQSTPQEGRSGLPMLLLSGRLELAEKNFRLARQVLAQATQRFPKSSTAHFLLAKAYGGLGDEEAMERELRAALDLAPDAFLTRMVLTRLLLRKGAVDEAQKLFARLKQAKPDNPDVLALEAQFSSLEGDTQAVMKLLERRFQASPTTANLLGLTRYRWLRGDRAGAIDGLERWLRDNPDDVQARLTLADALLEEGRRDAAIAEYRRILEIVPDNVRAINNLAWELRETDPEAALNYAERARELAPDSATVLDTLAEVLLAAGNVERALRMNRRSLEKAPDSPTFKYRKARILEAQGKRDEAVAELTALLREGRRFPEQRQAEALLKRLQGG